jgi:hypothetical protein
MTTGSCQTLTAPVSLAGALGRMSCEALAACGFRVWLGIAKGRSPSLTLPQTYEIGNSFCGNGTIFRHQYHLHGAETYKLENGTDRTEFGGKVTLPTCESYRPWWIDRGINVDRMAVFQRRISKSKILPVT